MVFNQKILQAFTDLIIALSMFMLSFIFVIACGHFEGRRTCAFFKLFAYFCIVIGDPFIREGRF